jgi:hypothetical protein
VALLLLSQAAHIANPTITMSVPPVNLRRQNAAPSAIATATDYALQVAGHYVQWLKGAFGAGPDPSQPLLGKRVLEIGPGATLGAPALLACAGASMSVADRFLAIWDPEFHPVFFTELLRKLEARGDQQTAPIRRMLSDGGFAGVMQCYAVGAERIIDIEGHFDAILSNAVLEHVEDLDVTAANLAAKTVPGGANFHQVDFRDHRDFSRPLEFLSHGEEDFELRRQEAHCEWGTRWRAADVGAAFAAVGFSVRVNVNMKASPEYLADIRPRLQPQFSALSDDELGTISALFSLTRKAQPHPHGIEPEFFIEASRGVVDLANNAHALAARFREADLDSAQPALAALTNELRLFATLVEALRGPLAIDPRLLTIDDLTPDQQLTRLESQLKGLVDAQINGDWLSVADILEHDLEPLVRPWGRRVLEFGRVAQ